MAQAGSANASTDQRTPQSLEGIRRRSLPDPRRIDNIAFGLILGRQCYMLMAMQEYIFICLSNVKNFYVVIPKTGGPETHYDTGVTGYPFGTSFWAPYQHV